MDILQTEKFSFLPIINSVLAQHKQNNSELINISLTYSDLIKIYNLTEGIKKRAFLKYTIPNFE